MKENERKALEEMIKRVQGKLRITKVVCTRSVKGKQGDHYVGFSAAWDTIQDDAGRGADLISAQDEHEVQTAANQGMTLKEAQFAGLIVGRQADISAHNHAVAGSNITPAQHAGALMAIRSNYAKLMLDLLRGNGNGDV